jgi:hypothetical protein
MRLAVAVAWVLSAAPVAALQFEERPADTTVQQVGVVSVVTLEGIDYGVNRMPEVANQMKFVDELPDAVRRKAPQITSGLAMDEAEVTKVLEAWLRESAFDFDSLKIRGLTVGRPMYATWCAAPAVFGCMNLQVRAGVLVQYEINGKNRSGGPTGWRPEVLLIRRAK